MGLYSINYSYSAGNQPYPLGCSSNPKTGQASGAYKTLIRFVPNTGVNPINLCSHSPAPVLPRRSDTRDRSNYKREVQLTGSPQLPPTVGKTLDGRQLDWLERVIDGLQAVIEERSSRPNAPYAKATLTKNLKEKLIDYSQGELRRGNPAFIKQDYQAIQARVYQLSAQGVQLLEEPDKLSPQRSKGGYNNERYDSTGYQTHQKKPLTRQDSHSALSDASTASGSSHPPLPRQLSYSQLDAQATLTLNKLKDIHSASNKRYRDFYQNRFFNPQETTRNAVPAYQNLAAFTATKNKILNSGYNNFTADQILPLEKYSFFHQQQTGPYCQTVSVNNFLGDNLVTPEILHKILNLGDKHIGSELMTSDTLELTSLIRAEQRKFLQSLLACSDGILATSSMRQAIENAQYLIKELNCRACDLDTGNQQQLQKFIQAAEKAGSNRLHLTFPSSKNGMHAIALRRDPENPKLWIVLDGNLPTHRLSLYDALWGYSRKGSIRLIARKDLFKADPSIACYQIKRHPGNPTTLTQPSVEQLAQWRNLPLQYIEKRRFSVPEQIENDLYHWKKKHPSILLKRSRSAPIPQAYRRSNFETAKQFSRYYYDQRV